MKPVKMLNQRQAVEAAAQKVLVTRLQFPGSSLADLYEKYTAGLFREGKKRR